MSQPGSNSYDTFACVRCGATVPVQAVACPACGLEVYPAEDGEGECRCLTCGGAMTVEDKVCPHCGAEVVILKAPDEGYVCSVCGGDVAEDDTVCPHCGADVAEIEEAEAAPAADDDEGYVCSVCGGDVAEDDTVCPHCGADVAEIDDTPAEPLAHTFTLREVNFLKEADRLPEAVAAALTPIDGEKFVLPAREPKVGDLVIQFIHAEVIVSVGHHTQGRFEGAGDAVDFIDDVVNDRIVFHFVDGEVEVYKLKELDASDPIDWSYYVWSGPLRNQQTGIDWYRPPAP
jgi:DNA-directed RNA polymerase subunit RPC12/RpoP